MRGARSLAELVIQETEERVLQKEKEKMERAVKQRMDIAMANEYQRQLKAIRREEEKQEEEQFRTAMMEKFAEDDRLDQLNAQLFAASARAAVLRINEFNTQSIANMAWAFAKLDQLEEQLFAALARAALVRIS